MLRDARPPVDLEFQPPGPVVLLCDEIDPGPGELELHPMPRLVGGVHVVVDVVEVSLAVVEVSPLAVVGDRGVVVVDDPLRRGRYEPQGEPLRDDLERAGLGRAHRTRDQRRQGQGITLAQPLLLLRTGGVQLSGPLLAGDLHGPGRREPTAGGEEVRGDEAGQIRVLDVPPDVERLPDGQRGLHGEGGLELNRCAADEAPSAPIREVDLGGLGLGRGRRGGQEHPADHARHRGGETSAPPRCPLTHRMLRDSRCRPADDVKRETVKRQ